MEEVTSGDSQWSARDMLFSIFITYFEMGANNEMTVCAADSTKSKVREAKVCCEELLKAQRLVKSLNIQYRLCLIFEGSERICQDGYPLVQDYVEGDVNSVTSLFWPHSYNYISVWFRSLWACMP